MLLKKKNSATETIRAQGLYLVLAVVVVLGLYLNQSAPEKPRITPARAKPKKEMPRAAVIESDFRVRLDGPEVAVHNQAFVPLVKKAGTSQETFQEKIELTKVPPEFAQGEGDWVFNGFVISDGKKMALLENTEKGLSGFVKVGEIWKGTKIVSISQEIIVMQGSLGKTETVHRYTGPVAAKIAPTDSGGFQPMNLGGADLSGPIGQEIPILPPVRRGARRGQ